MKKLRKRPSAKAAKPEDRQHICMKGFVLPNHFAGPNNALANFPTFLASQEDGEQIDERDSSVVTLAFFCFG